MIYNNIGEIRAIAPFPWQQQVSNKGVVRLLDAAGNEVPLFAITGLACMASMILQKVPENNVKETPQ
jgi:hypothetical protein